MPGSKYPMLLLKSHGPDLSLSGSQAGQNKFQRYHLLESFIPKPQHALRNCMHLCYLVHKRSIEGLKTRNILNDIILFDQEIRREYRYKEKVI